MGGLETESELEGGDLRADVLVSNRYRVESLLGEGGAASVYRVRDARSGQRVALKQLRTRGSSHEALLTSQFEREYHTLSELAHPSIIEVYDYGVDRRGPYYTMELLDGEDLSERGPLPFREVCKLLCDVASSLAVVHSRNRVHRDVTARNVRCTRAGRAKLLDFGAMAPGGMAHPMIGTPPFVPPEAVQLQSLDGRVDLYALGALAYFMLTGRHAFPAQTFTQLRDLWRTAAPTPRQYDPSLPEALDRLVMELLQLERAARPSAAAEVMERLAGIAGLPLQELPAVQRAYLSVPTLVGRAGEVQQVRASLAQALQGRGGSVLIEGAPGIGRTRMLDACVLEAKLIGAVVLRADASGRSQEGEYGLVRRMCSELMAAVPVQVEQSARPRRSLLQHVITELSPGGTACVVPQRRQLQAALRDFFLSVAREQLIVIAVDDIELADEASAALLGMLAHGAARRRLCLVLTAVRGEQPSPVLMLLRQIARSIVLPALLPEQTASLVRSVFGAAEHTAQLSERIHNLSEGNPRWVMTLCEHLVERGIARYHAGRWSLPAELGPDAIPSSLAAALSARLDALAPDARDLAQTLALSDPAVLTLPDFAALSPDTANGGVYRALDALVTARVLVAAHDRHQFAQSEFPRLLCAEIPAAQARVRHERLAAALRGGPHVVLRAHHLRRAGRAEEAIDAIMAQPGDLSNLAPASCERIAETLLGALQEARDLNLRRRFEASVRLLVAQTLLGQREAFLRSFPTVLERLEHDAGFADYAGLTAGSETERVALALARASERYANTPPEERVFSPDEAHGMFVHAASCLITMASIGQEVELLERVPACSAFSEVAPAIAALLHSLEIVRTNLSGRPGGIMMSAALVERLRAENRSGLTPVTARAWRMGQLYMQGVIRALFGADVPSELLAELEQAAGFRAQAWRVRMISEFMHADFQAAQASERRAALIGLQDGGMLPGTTLRGELSVQLAAENLGGVQKCLERCAQMAAQYPGWRSTHAIARCHTLRLQGDLEGALAALRPALELTEPGKHLDWPWAMQSEVQVLSDLGRAEDAVACARRAQELAGPARIWFTGGFRLTLAIALLRKGDVAAAEQGIAGVIGEFTQLNTYGLMLGAAYEAQARVAIAKRDGVLFHHAAERCAREFKVAENAVMKARYERLLREADHAGLELPASAQFQAAAARTAGDVVARTVYSRMLTCIGPAERAREVLRLLLDESRARSGYLFGHRGGDLTLLASVDDSETPADLTASLEAYLRDELEDNERAHQALSAATPAEPLQPWVDGWGREFEPLVLLGAHEGESVIAAIAALHHELDERPALTPGLLQALTVALIAEDLVDPITIVG